MHVRRRPRESAMLDDGSSSAANGILRGTVHPPFHVLHSRAPLRPSPFLWNALECLVCTRLNGAMSRRAASPSCPGDDRATCQRIMCVRGILGCRYSYILIRNGPHLLRRRSSQSSASTLYARYRVVERRNSRDHER
ncbi:hypothetical protein, variant [Aphanomyces invadans]|uniref:Uncharacterized protein n=1 Tax=Aphanomyces invadans TaxID=157072 RepID=A0A024U9T9_9STRA|nr:hypothetical protein, variant [Aphanomyces invadans]ETW03191.1 hypothetical protein, variant [Aphanomyces invadans]|eukprot:XP_008868575.1 hypothetical protein, variant [Aphanomyces invadans]